MILTTTPSVLYYNHGHRPAGGQRVSSERSSTRSEYNGATEPAYKQYQQLLVNKPQRRYYVNTNDLYGPALPADLYGPSLPADLYTDKSEAEQ